MLHEGMEAVSRLVGFVASGLLTRMYHSIVTASGSLGLATVTIGAGQEVALSPLEHPMKVICRILTSLRVLVVHVPLDHERSA